MQYLSYGIKRRQTLQWSAAALACLLSDDVLKAQSLTPPPESPISGMELVVLGSGGPGATGRAGTCYLVLLDGVPRVMLDAGPGAFARFGEAHLNLQRMDTVLLTHLHADHAGGLPGLVKARAVSARGKIHFTVFGPNGHRATRTDEGHFPSTSRFIDLLFGPNGAFAYLSDFSAPISFKSHNVVGSTRIQTLFEQDGLRIQAASGHHRDAPSLIYRLDYQGKSMTFSGDMDPKGHATLSQMAQGCDLLVFNAVVLDPPGSPEVLYTLHTAPADIGRMAEQAGVHRLLLSHLNPTIDNNQESVLASIAKTYKGPVRFATDGMRVKLD
jgi:ribonuclease BN (tRNA processing enzyme)